MKAAAVFAGVVGGMAAALFVDDLRLLIYMLLFNPFFGGFLVILGVGTLIGLRLDSKDHALSAPVPGRTARLPRQRDRQERVNDE